MLYIQMRIKIYRRPVGTFYGKARKYENPN